MRNPSSVPVGGPNRRVVLAGNNEAGCLVLDLLLEALSPADVLVVAPPGGVHHGWQPSLAAAAAESGVTAIAPADVNAPETVERVRAHGAGLLLSIYYTQIFRAELLDAVAGPAINFHPSLLPRHRGVAPLVWSLVEGDTATGVTAHHIDATIDTGAVLLQRPLPIHPADTGYDLHRKAARLVAAVAAELLREWLATGELPAGAPQTGTGSYHSLRDPQVNRLQFDQPAERVRNIVRALAPPLPGAWCEIGGRRLTFERVSHAAPQARSKPPGMLERLPDGGWAVWAQDGPLRIDAFNDGGASRPSADLLAFTHEGEMAA
jgi:methionyl-tRNA formyltransferase